MPPSPFLADRSVVKSAVRVLLHFARANIPVLPLHDSFLMHHGYESTLGPVMEEAFEEVIGVLPLIDRKETPPLKTGFYAEKTDLFGANLTDEISEMLLELDVGYENRLAAFRTLLLKNS